MAADLLRPDVPRTASSGEFYGPVLVVILEFRSFLTLHSRPPYLVGTMGDADGADTVLFTFWLQSSSVDTEGIDLVSPWGRWSIANSLPRT